MCWSQSQHFTARQQVYANSCIQQQLYTLYNILYIYIYILILLLVIILIIIIATTTTIRRRGYSAATQPASQPANPPRKRWWSQFTIHDTHTHTHTYHVLKKEKRNDRKKMKMKIHTKLIEERRHWWPLMIAYTGSLRTVRCFCAISLRIENSSNGSHQMTTTTNWPKWMVVLCIRSNSLWDQMHAWFQSFMSPVYNNFTHDAPGHNWETTTETTERCEWTEWTEKTERIRVNTRMTRFWSRTIVLFNLNMDTLYGQRWGANWNEMGAHRNRYLVINYTNSKRPAPIYRRPSTDHERNHCFRILHQLLR